MNIFSIKDHDNDVEVTYTGEELFRLKDSNGSYNAKISVKDDGSFDYYDTKSDWDDHSHKHFDENGNCTYDRPEGKNHSWKHWQKD